MNRLITGAGLSILILTLVACSEGVKSKKGSKAVITVQKVDPCDNTETLKKLDELSLSTSKKYAEVDSIDARNYELMDVISNAAEELSSSIGVGVNVVAELIKESKSELISNKEEMSVLKDEIAIDKLAYDRMRLLGQINSLECSNIEEKKALEAHLEAYNEMVKIDSTKGRFPGEFDRRAEIAKNEKLILELENKIKVLDETGVNTAEPEYQ